MTPLNTNPIFHNMRAINPNTILLEEDYTYNHQNLYQKYVKNILKNFDDKKLNFRI